MVILAAPDVIEVVLNFIAIAIIADFDDFVFSVIKNDHNRNTLLDNDEVDQYLLEIYHTTSKNAPKFFNDNIDVPCIKERKPDEKDVKKKAKKNKNIVYVGLHLENRELKIDFW